MALSLVEDKPFGLFSVLVADADDLPVSCVAGCRIKYSGQNTEFELNTQPAAEKHTHARWFEEFDLYMDKLSSPLKFTVLNLDRELVFDHVSIDVRTLEPRKRYDEWFPLTKSGGKLHLIYSFLPMGYLPNDYESKTRVLPHFRLALQTGSEVVTGDYLEGHVVLTTPAPFPIEKLFIRILGTEKVAWWEYDVDDERELYEGSSTVVNKWYHGWQNDKGATVDPGYYSWHFRVKMPAGLPPTFQDDYGSINYDLYAFLDHDRHTPAVPLKVKAPIRNQIPPEKIETKHNISVHATLDSPVYYVEDLPIKVKVKLTVKNLSDYEGKHIKLYVQERASYAASRNVNFEVKNLIKEKIADKNEIRPHKAFTCEHTLILPPDYDRLSINQSLGANRIHIEHSIRIKVVKDNIGASSVIVYLPFVITQKGDVIAERRQVIALTPETNISPLTPAVERKIARQKRRSSKIRREKEDPMEIDEPPRPFLQPIADNLIPFETPVTPTLIPPNPFAIEGSEIQMSGWQPIFNPFLPQNNPFQQQPVSASPSTLAAPPPVPRRRSSDRKSLPRDQVPPVHAFDAHKANETNPFLNVVPSNPFTFPELHAPSAAAPDAPKSSEVLIQASPSDIAPLPPGSQGGSKLGTFKGSLPHMSKGVEHH